MTAAPCAAQEQVMGCAACTAKALFGDAGRIVHTCAPQEPEEPDGFDLEEAQAARDEGMERAEASARAEWKAAAASVVRELAMTQAAFTSEDVWRQLKKPREPRALGPILAAAAREGLIERTDTFVQTSMVSRHAAPIVVWKSLARAR